MNPMILLLSTLICMPAIAQLETDIIPTSAGDLKITLIGHGSLIFGFAGKTIYVDPYGRLTDYSKLPSADLILITHEHPEAPKHDL